MAPVALQTVNSDEHEDTPPPEVVARLKAALLGRDIHRVEMVAGEESFVFVMTGPTKSEWKKYRSEVGAATGDIDKIENAIERGALAQIRWPDREEVLQIFNSNPGLVQNFHEELAKLAKAEVEVRTKKL